MYKIDAIEAEKIREEMKRTEKAKIYRKLQAVALRGEGKTNAEISAITKYNSNYISELCKTYVNNGISALVTDGRKGGNNRHMNETEAFEFLRKYEEQAKNGQIVTVETISKGYDEAVNKEHKSKSSVYYFLKKYEWRKVVPKKQHPGKATDAEIEASKKLTLR